MPLANSRLCIREPIESKNDGERAEPGSPTETHLLSFGNAAKSNASFAGLHRMLKIIVLNKNSFWAKLFSHDRGRAQLFPRRRLLRCSAPRQLEVWESEDGQIQRFRILVRSIPAFQCCKRKNRGL